MKQSSPGEVAEMFKSLVRPFIICTAWVTWLLLVVTETEAPVLLTGVASAITAEYVIERVAKRLKST